MKNYFHALKINFHALKIYFRALQIYFQATKIVSRLSSAPFLYRHPTTIAEAAS